MRERNYWILTVSELTSQAGNLFRLVTVTTFTFMLTNSILATALQYLFTSLPGFIFSGYAGKISDRVRPKVGMVLISILSAGGTLLYLVSRNAWLIYSLNIFMATAGLMGSSMRAVWLPRIVSRSEIAKRNGIRSALGGFIDLLFPTIGGLAIAALGVRVGFFFDSASFLLAAGGFLLTSDGVKSQVTVDNTGSVAPETIDDPQRDASPDDSVYISGWQFFKSRHNLLIYLLAYVVLGATGQALSAVFLPFLDYQFGVGAAAFGIVISLYLVGNILSGAAIARWHDRITPKGALLLLLITPFDWIGMLYSPDVVVLLFFVLINGCIMTGAISLLMSICQSEAPESIVGRVFATAMTFHFGAEAVGTIGGGLIAMTFGFAANFWIMSTMSFVLLTLICCRAYVRRAA